MGKFYGGLDLGSGITAFGNAIQSGYQANQEMQAKRAAAALQQQQMDYLYPRETVIPLQIANDIAQGPLNIMAQASGLAQSMAPQEPTQSTKFYDVSRGKVIDPTMAAPSKNNRSPNSEPVEDIQITEEPIGVSQAAASDQIMNTEQDQVHKLAQNLGLVVRDGQLVAKGAQGKQILDLYEKLIGSSAAAYNYSARAAQPSAEKYIPINQPSRSSGGGSRSGGGPDDIRIQIQSIDGELRGLQSKIAPGPLDQTRILMLRKQKDNLLNQSSQRGGRAPQSDSGGSAAKRAFSRSQNKTYLFDINGNVVGIEDGDTRQ